MQNVNILIVVKVLECIHASTVERSLPQLRGPGGGGSDFNHLTLPPLSASVHQYLSPVHFFLTWVHHHTSLRGTSDT